MTTMLALGKKRDGNDPDLLVVPVEKGEGVEDREAEGRVAHVSNAAQVRVKGTASIFRSEDPLLTCFV